MMAGSNPITLTLASEADTQRLGRILAEQLPPTGFIALCGTLGAGKTRLVQAIAEACGVPREQVVSPTFTLCNEYQANSHRIYHVDLYRVGDEDEAEELGLEECYAAGRTLVEWADRFPSLLPPSYIWIELEVVAPLSRRAHLSRCPADPAWLATIQRLWQAE